MSVALQSKDKPSPASNGLPLEDILISQRCDLFLGLVIVCELLLVLLPILPSRTRHLALCSLVCFIGQSVDPGFVDVRRRVKDAMKSGGRYRRSESYDEGDVGVLQK